MRTSRGMIGAALLALTLTACGGTPKTVATPSSQETTPTPAVCVSSPELCTPDEATPDEDIPTTVTVGKCEAGGYVHLGDWTITFVKFERNANKAIRAANMFNDKPQHQYVLVTYKAKYTGDERTGDVESDLTWTLTGANKVVNDQTYVVTPYDDADKSTTARKGGTVSAQVAFDANPKGAILAVEVGFDGDYAECNL